MVLAAIMIALVLVVTMFVKIPIPFGPGYIHLGDAVIYLASMLGGGYGFLVGGIGTALADILSGYASYAIASFIVHGIQGYLFALLYHRKNGLTRFQFILGAFIIGILTVVLGYFITDVILTGQPLAALISAGFNVLQVAAGSIVAGLLFVPLKKWLKD